MRSLILMLCLSLTVWACAPVPKLKKPQQARVGASSRAAAERAETQKKDVQKRTNKQGKWTQQSAPKTNKFTEGRKRENFKRNQEMAESPQYTDPTYFGHKKPPKKRPAGKKKLCKECGMWH